jgi:POT family proton-dependent oligopeptide transporter
MSESPVQVPDTGASKGASAGWFGHPRPLARLFTTEMWERLGFYGMRALLTLYLTKHVVLGDRAATGLYGGYLALIYLTPLVGGFVADQYLGSKRSVKFGALMMACGYFAMAFTGSPTQSWLEYDGARHPVAVVGFHDGPTSGANEHRQVVDHGRTLTIAGQKDGGIALSDERGAVVRTLPKGGFHEGSDPDRVRVLVLLIALATVGVGNGFFKPNISTMVGALYAPGDRRRDAGFTIFYMGINLGSVLGQILSPILADLIGWWAGFGIAGLGMIVAWALVQFDGGRLAGYGEPPVRRGRDPLPGVVLGAAALVPVFVFLFWNQMHAPEAAAGSGLGGYLAALPLMGKVMFGTFVLSIPAILAWAWRAGSRQEFEMMLAAMVLIVFNVVFWTLFEQAGSSLTLFADRNADRSIFGLFTLSAPQVQQFNSMFIILGAPLLGGLWGWLARRGAEPSIPVKFGVALIGVGAGFLLLVLGSRFVDAQFRVSIWWLVGLYLFHSLAELCISPVGLSMITKLSIVRVVGLMMGTWFLSMAMGEYVAGMVAQFASVSTVGGQITNPALSLATYVGVFSHIGWVAMGVGVLLLVLARPIKRLMHGVT